MFNEKKIFTGGLNNDDDLRLLSEGEYLNLMNGRVGISENGKDGRIENVLGNIELQNPYLPSGDNQTIGSAVDYQRKRLLIANWNSNGEDGWYVYDIPSSTFYKAIVNSNLILSIGRLGTNSFTTGSNQNLPFTGAGYEGDILQLDFGLSGTSVFVVYTTVGYYEDAELIIKRLVVAINTNSYAITNSILATYVAPNVINVNFNGITYNTNFTRFDASIDNKPLNFSKDFRIDRNAKMVGDLLYWCDGDQNPPRKINIEAGIKTNHPTYVTDTLPYSLPIDYKWIQWVKRPPIYPLTWEKKVKDTTSIVNQFINIQNYSGVYRIGIGQTVYDFLVPSIGDRIELTGTTNNNKIFTILSITPPGAGAYWYLTVLEVTVVESAYNATLRQADVPASNAIADELFYFGYYYEFYDNEVSAISMLSDVCYTNTVFDVLKMSYYVYGFTNSWVTLKKDDFNTIYLKIPFEEKIPKEVKSVYLVCKIGQTGSVSAIKKIDKENKNDKLLISNHNNSITPIYWIFYNNVKDYTLDSVFSNTSQDIVPLNINTFDVAKNRLMPANFISGYNSNIPTSLKINFSFATISNSPYIIYRSFINKSKYQVAITFYDEFKRCCGGITNDDLIINLNISDESNGMPNTTFIPVQINWTLNNANAINEIPNWAFYYSIDISKNLNFSDVFSIYCVRFGNADNGIRYVDKQGDKYSYRYGGYRNPGLLNLAQYIGVSIKNINSLYDDGSHSPYYSLNGYNGEYSFEKGDYCDLYFYINTNSNRKYIKNVRIKEYTADGYILLEGLDVGTIPQPGSMTDSQTIYMCIYRPTKKVVNEPFYQTGNIYKITNPQTLSREYSVLYEIINGDGYYFQYDITNIQYLDCPPLAMYFNNINNKSKSLNQGYPNFIDTIGQKRLTDTIAWSDTYIQGTKTNGLNKFQPLNRKSVGLENGVIQKLQLTNKQQEDGKVMLAYCTNSILSIYLGEVQLVASAKDANVATSQEVIGTINALKLNTSTQTPSSVIEWNGEVFAIDLQTGYVSQYATNGLYPVSNYKMQRFFKEWTKAYKATSKAAITALNGFSHITFCIDPYHNELIAMLPALVDESTAPKLPSYDNTTPPYASSIIDRKDVLDKLAKTVSFSPAKNKWGATYEFIGEWAENIDNTLFTFKNGKLWQHNVNNEVYNTFYGVQKPLRVVFSLSQNPSAVKDMLNIAVEGNKAPDFTVLHNLYPNEQITDLIGEDFTTIDGVHYASFRMDRLSPNVIGTAVRKMYEGDLIKGVSPVIMLEFRQYNNLVYINFTDIGYDIPYGHTTILKQ